MQLGSIISGVVLAALLSACTEDVNQSDNPYHVEFSSPDNLVKHAEYLKEELFQIGEHSVWDYNTPNKGFGNIIMIEGDDGIIIVDTSTASDHAKVANTAFRKITDKPIKAIIYTHHHADHINGQVSLRHC